MGEDVDTPTTTGIAIVEAGERSNSELWGKTTNPENHNPANFRYLVHMFNPYNEQFNLGNALAGEGHSEKQAVNLLDEPERIAERVSLSMSLIDQDHMNVWGPGGLIVSTPENNVVITSPHDLGARNSNSEVLLEQSKGYNRLTSDEILEQTPKDKYNEIVAFGESEAGDKLKLTGVVIVKDIDGDVGDVVIIERLENQAERLNVPLVEVPYYQPNDREVVRSDGELTAQYDGRVYLLKRKGFGTPFTATTGVKSYFAAQDEVNSVLDYFQKTGAITEEEAMDLRKDYQEAYKKAMKPIIAQEGQTNYITFKTGVGKDYEEYNHRAGKIYRVSVGGNKREQEEISNDDFVKALEANKNNMSEDEYSRILERVRE